MSRPDATALLLSGGLAAVLARALGRGRVPGGLGRWARTNHAGRTVLLTEGLAAVGGTCGAAAVLAASGLAGPATAGAMAAAASGAGLAGAIDDLGAGSTPQRKGLRGHLGALAGGTVTTGVLKVVALTVSGVLAARLVDRGTTGRTPVDTVVAGAVVAGSANLANLLDLRPGRALKAVLAVAVPLVLTGPGSPAGATTAGAALALLPDDLAGRTMLGDTGANPLGALLGVALVQRQGRAARLGTLGVLTALTLTSERVSFTAVIEATPVLRELDRLGRPVP